MFQTVYSHLFLLLSPNRKPYTQPTSLSATDIRIVESPAVFAYFICSRLTYIEYFTIIFWDLINHDSTHQQMMP
jgi:hypothetical protein